MEIIEKIVDFERYCKTCKYYKLEKNENGQEPEPCNECLENPTNIHSQKPVKYEENVSMKGSVNNG